MLPFRLRLSSLTNMHRPDHLNARPVLPILARAPSRTRRAA
jgi:hypothetical protein